MKERSCSSWRLSRTRKGCSRERAGPNASSNGFWAIRRIFRPATDMQTVYIEEIAKHEGEEVELRGWLHNRRSSGKIHFLIVRDGTGFTQAVMSKAAVGDGLFQRTDHLGQESSIVVTG